MNAHTQTKARRRRQQVSHAQLQSLPLADQLRTAAKFLDEANDPSADSPKTARWHAQIIVRHVLGKLDGAEGSGLR